MVVIVVWWWRMCKRLVARESETFYVHAVWTVWYRLCLPTMYSRYLPAGAGIAAVSAGEPHST